MVVFLSIATSIAVSLSLAGKLAWSTSALIALLLALSSLWVWLVDTLLEFEPGWDELHIVTTQDGWTLPLYRYRTENPRAAALLVHGIYSSMAVFDLGPEESLARHLSNEGYDVYCLELRDMGRHGRRVRRWRVASEGASFDDYVRHDLPAAIDHVVETSGFETIDYVGHSMGGMIFYPYGGTEHGQKHVRRAVTLGALGGLPARGWLRYLPIPWGLIVRIPHYGVREAARYLLAPLVGIGWLVEARFLNPRHASRAARRRYFATGVANSPHTLLRHFGDMYRDATTMSRDGRDDYAALLASNAVPTLVLAGQRDKIAPLTLVRAGYDALAGEKKWRVFGKDNGSRFDFGHTDLVFGGAARREVWPLIDQWLREV